MSDTTYVRNLAVRLALMDGGRFKADFIDVTDTGENGLKKIELAGQPASKSLIALNAAANDVRASAVGLTSQIGPLGAAMAALGPVGIAVGAALGAVTLGMSASVKEAAEAEQAYNKLQAVLRATGNASGLTVREISTFADRMEATTLTTAEGVMNAASVLATFRSVSGDSFTRTIKLAQDMSSVFDKDLNASIMALGKALENPVDGLGALRKAGVEFSDSQKKMLQDMVDSSEEAKAQKIILDKLASSLAGTGEAEAAGVTGAAHKLSVSWKNMLEAIGETSAVSSTAQGSLEVLAAALNGIGGLFKDAPLDKQLDEAKAKLIEAQAVLERLQNYNPRVMTDMSPLIDSQRGKIESLRKEIEELTTARKNDASAQAVEKAAALKGQQRAENNRNDEIAEDRRKKIDEALEKLISDPAKKIVAVNAELEKTGKQLEKLRNSDGSNGGLIDDTLSKAKELAHLKIEDIQKPHYEASRADQKVLDDLKRQLLGVDNARQAFIDQAVARLSDKADAGKVKTTRDLAGKLFDQKTFAEAQKVIDDLTRQIEKATNKKQAFIDESVSRLPKGATQEEINRTKELAGAAYEQIQAREKLDKLKEEGKQLTDSDKTATEAYADRIAKLNELLDAGAISQNIYNRAKAKAAEQLMEGRTDPQSGALRAFASYQKAAENSADAVEKAFTSAMKATEDIIVNTVMSGKISLSKLDDFANDIVADITRMLVQKSITGPLYKMLGSSFEEGGIMSGLMDALSFHEGGTVGKTSARLTVPAYVFAGAPRYHSGGFPGLRADEVPAILQKGERVIAKNAQTVTPISVVMHISTPDASSFRASQAQISAEAARGIGRAKRNL